MDLRITLFAVCLALALPASAVYAQDDCEEADCERSDEAAAAAEMDADDSSSDEAEAVSAEDAESEGFEADEPPAQVVDLDKVSGHVSPVVVIAIGDMPVSRQIRSGGLLATERLKQ